MYAKKPQNFSEIIEIVTTTLPVINRNLHQIETIIFYDTCSLANHARKNQKTEKYDLIDYFSAKDLIIITDKIIEEMMNPTTGEVSEPYLYYLKELKKKVKDIILLCECQLENLLSLKFDDKLLVRSKIQQCIKIAFSDLPLKMQKQKIFNADINSPDFLKTVLSAIDVAKTNRGEISILICLLCLEQLKKKNCRIITDDRKSIPYLMKPFNSGQAESYLSIETTPKIVQNLIKHSSLWSSKKVNEIEDILNTIRHDQENNIFYKRIIDGITYENIIKNALSNREIAEGVTSNLIDIVF